MRLVDLYWPVAQMVERLTVNQMVAGSSPAVSTKIKSRHLLKTEDVDFSLCKKYVIMKQKRGNKRELYKTSKRVLRKAQ